MVSTDFEESNHVLDKPLDMSRDQCEPLNVLVAISNDNLPVIISCWKLTKEELALINKTGRLYLTVIGRTMPPVSLDVAKWFNNKPPVSA